MSDNIRDSLTAEQIDELGRQALEKLGACPTCGVPLLMLDNNVWLEPGAVPRAVSPLAMQIMPLAGMLFACGDGGKGGLGHLLHEHQPPETS